MKTIDYLELIKNNNRVKGQPCSDYRAAQLLQIDRSAIVRYKQGRQMDDEVAIRAADLLSLDPAAVLLDMQINRAKTPDIKSTWEKIRKALNNTTAALLTAAILSPGYFLESPQEAVKYEILAEFQKEPPRIVLILCKIAFCLTLCRAALHFLTSWSYYRPLIMS